MKNEWIDRLRECVDRDGRSMRAISIASGNGQNWLQQVLKDGKDPGFARLARLLDSLGAGATLYVISGTRLDERDAELLRILLSLPPRVRGEALDLFRAIEAREDQSEPVLSASR